MLQPRTWVTRRDFSRAVISNILRPVALQAARCSVLARPCYSACFSALFESLQSPACRPPCHNLCKPSSSKLVKPHARQPVQIQLLTFADNFSVAAHNKYMAASTHQPAENTTMTEPIAPGSSQGPIPQVAQRTLRQPKVLAPKRPTPLKIFSFSTDFLQSIYFRRKMQMPMSILPYYGTATGISLLQQSLAEVRCSRNWSPIA